MEEDYSDVMGVPDISLGPLANNGGPTMTHALLSGSPALDMGLDADCPATDQRGLSSPVDGDMDGFAHCDVGAFEAQLPAPTSIATLDAAAIAAFLVLIALAGIAVLRFR